MEHSDFSPSKLSRIIKCSGSVSLIKSLEPKEEELKDYTIEGIMLHEVIAKCLIEAYNNQLPEYNELSKEHKGLIDICKNVVKEIYNKEMFSYKGIELKIPNILETGVFGTSDLVIRTNNALHIFDWKFGGSIEVYPENNYQLMAYAIGAAYLLSKDPFYEFSKIKLHIVQPRFSPSHKVHETSMEVLQYWLDYVLIPALDDAKSQNPSFNAGEEQCRWCDASSVCKHNIEYNTYSAGKAFAVAKTIENKVATKDHIVNVLDKTKALTNYLKEIKSYALSLLLNGEEIPGYKLVNGRATRYWLNEDSVFDYLSSQELEDEEIFEKKIISPAKAEKLNGHFKKDKYFKTLIGKILGNPIIAKESDRRKDYEIPDKTEAANAIFKDSIKSEK